MNAVLRKPTKVNIALVFILSLTLVLGMIPFAPFTNGGEVYAADPDILVSDSSGTLGGYDYDVEDEYGYDSGLNIGAYLTYTRSGQGTYSNVHGVEIEKIIDTAAGAGFYANLNPSQMITFVSSDSSSKSVKAGTLKETRYNFAGAEPEEVPAIIAFDATGSSGLNQSALPRNFYGQKLATDNESSNYVQNVVSIIIGDKPDIEVSDSSGDLGGYFYNVEDEFGYLSGVGRGSYLTYTRSGQGTYSNVHGVEIEKIIDAAAGAGFYADLNPSQMITFVSSDSSSKSVKAGTLKETRYNFAGAEPEEVPAIIAFDATGSSGVNQSALPRNFYGQKLATDNESSNYVQNVVSIIIGDKPDIEVFDSSGDLGGYFYDVEDEYGYDSGSGELVTYSALNSFGTFSQTVVRGVEVKKIINEAAGDAGYFDSLGNLTEITFTANDNNKVPLTVGQIKETRYRFESSTSAIAMNTVPALIAWEINGGTSGAPRLYIGQTTSLDVNNGYFNKDIVSITIGENKFPPDSDFDDITIFDGVSELGAYEYKTADEYMSGAELTYTATNSANTKSTYTSVHGVTVKEVINDAAGDDSFFDSLDPERIISFVGRDGRSAGTTVKQLKDIRYSFAGSTPTEVPALISYGYCSGNNEAQPADLPRNFMGQKSINDQTSGTSTKGLEKIVIGTLATKLPVPTINPPAGSAVIYGTLLRLSSSISDAKIYYTLDGTEPTANSRLYNEVKDSYLADVGFDENPPIVATAKGTLTIKAKVVALGYIDSDTVTFTYTITGDKYLGQLKADAINTLENNWFAATTKAKYADVNYIKVLLLLNKTVKAIQAAADQDEVQAIIDAADKEFKKIPRKVDTFKSTKPKVKAIKAGKKKATVTWNTVTDAAGYEITYSTTKNFKNKKMIIVKNSKAAKKVIKKLKAGKKHHIKIRAYGIFDGKKEYTKYSNIKSSKKIKK